MLLQGLLWIDIGLSVLFIALCVAIAVRTRLIQTIPIALALLALALQYVFTVAQLPGWVDNAELRSYWNRFFFAVLIVALCVHLVLILRNWRGR